MNEDYEKILDGLKAHSHFRNLKNFDDKDEKFIYYKGKKLLNLSSNNYLNFAQKLEMYANVIIYPLPLLKDFHDNKFLSVEQRRYEKQYRQTWLAIVIAALSSLLGALLEKII